MQIYVINQSTKVSAAEAALMVTACNHQVVADLSPAWSKLPIPVMLLSSAATVPAGSYAISILDNPDQPDALGYHSEQGDIVYGKIFVDPVLSNGGVVLYDAKNPQNVSVSSVLSHEVCELIVDRYCNLWADGPALPQGSSYAYEVADPVEGDSYAINLGTAEAPSMVSVSNFVTPHWFDEQATAGQYFDRLHKLNAPFTMTPGGYLVVRNAPGSEQQVFGETLPAAWRVAVKKANVASRLNKRKVK